MRIKLIKHDCTNKMMIKIKNKKAYNALEVVIGAAVLIFLLWAIVYLIFPILTNKEVPIINAQAEQVTQDCDEDGVIGVADPCPCDSSIKSKEELEKAKKCSNPSAGSSAATNCPNLCKHI